MKSASENTLIKALDTAVAFATLETFGVVDARDQTAETSAGPARGTQRQRFASTHVPSTHPNLRGRGDRTAHVGRPGAATAAGLRHHRSALRRLDRLHLTSRDRAGAAGR